MHRASRGQGLQKRSLRGLLLLLRLFFLRLRLLHMGRRLLLQRFSLVSCGSRSLCRTSTRCIARSCLWRAIGFRRTCYVLLLTFRLLFVRRRLGSVLRRCMSCLLISGRWKRHILLSMRLLIIPRPGLVVACICRRRRRGWQSGPLRLRIV